ncbi:MAG: hypothetical protein N0E37_05995, partial [Candidatus Thiodiazotropha taylori]|nr:hypothetical protein [Candidatus Thiodiazotropha taylori]MCW4243974.1 hypothetical protein [Candidatus Thiodiazotropha taylori]
VHDAVPHLPPTELGFRHHSSVYLIAFHATDILGKLDLKVAHSSDNYQAVISCARRSSVGGCNNKRLQVAERLTICSELPALEDH